MMDSEKIIYNLCDVKYRIPKPDRIEFYLIPHKTKSRLTLQQLCDAIEPYTDDLMFDIVVYTIDPYQVDVEFLKAILERKRINAKITLIR